jgi:hypothetical protein
MAAAIDTSERGVKPEYLSKVWKISFEDAKRTIDVTSQLLLKIGSMVVPLRPAFCLMVILFYLVVSYPTATESTGYETKSSVDLVCLL